MKLSTMIDRFYEARELRREADKTVAELKAKENELKAKIIARLEKDKLTGAAGKFVNFAVKEENEPTARDWDQVHSYIVEHDAWDLVYRRLNNAAIKERWDAGEKIPGVDAYPVTKVSVTKVK